MASLVLVRHAQASLFASDYDQLSDLGRSQATALGTAWKVADPGFDRAFTGPAKRHRDTYEIARQSASGLPDPAVLDGFDEHDAFSLVRGAAQARVAADPALAQHAALAASDGADPAARSGAWQRVFEAVMHGWIDGDISVDGVEPWTDFEQRVSTALRTALASGGRRVIVVSSVGPVAVVLRHALKLDPHQAFETAWRTRNTAVSRFLFSGDRFTLDTFNGVTHLPDPTTHTHR